MLAWLVVCGWALGLLAQSPDCHAQDAGGSGAGNAAAGQTRGGMGVMRMLKPQEISPLVPAAGPGSMPIGEMRGGTIEIRGITPQDVSILATASGAALNGKLRSLQDAVQVAIRKAAGGQDRPDAVPINVMKAFIFNLRSRNVPRSEWLGVLGVLATQYQELGRRVAGTAATSGAIKQVLARVDAARRQGQMEDADRLLDAAVSMGFEEKRRMKEQPGAARRQLGSLYASMASVAFTQLEWGRGASLLGLAFSQVEDDPPREAFWWLIDAGDGWIAAGRGFDAQDMYRRAREVATALAADSSSTEWLRNIFVSENKLGSARGAQGDLADALKSYQAGLATAQKLAQQDPASAGAQRDLAVSQENIGDILLAQQDPAGALASYQRALAVREKLVQADPGNAGWQRDLFSADIKAADAMMAMAAQDDVGGALKLYHSAYAIARTLADAGAGSSGSLHDLAVSEERNGDALWLDDPPGALSHYQASLTLRLKLAQADPDDAIWQHDLSICDTKIGDALTLQRDLGGALASYRVSLTIRQGLARAHPDNASWQRDVAAIQEKIGETLLAQHDRAGAVASYQASLAILERLTQADPGNDGLQHALSDSRTQIAKSLTTSATLLTFQGDLPGALASLQAGLAIQEQQARADPAQLELQRTVADTQSAIAANLAAQHDLPGALKSGQAALATLQKLASQASPGWSVEEALAQGEMDIGTILAAQGDLPGALARYQASLTIARKLVHADPAFRAGPFDQFVAEGKIGDILTAQGDLRGALQSYRAELATLEKLAADPDGAGWEDQRSGTEERIGNTLGALGDLEGALASYQTAVALRWSLDQEDLDSPRNVTANDKVAIGDILLALAQGARVVIPSAPPLRQSSGTALTSRDRTRGHEALTSYEDALTLALKLDAANPADAQGLLFRCHERIGDAQAVLGDLETAFKSYQTALGIARQSSASQPSNVGWERSLMLVNWRLGTLLAAGNPPQLRREHLTTARTLAKELQQAGKLTPKEQGWPAQIGQALQQLDRN